MEEFFYIIFNKRAASKKKVEETFVKIMGIM